MEIPSGVIKKPPVSSFRHSIKSFFSILIYSIIVGKHTLGVKLNFSVFNFKRDFVAEGSFRFN